MSNHPLQPPANAQAELVSCVKIWDQAPHNAFTDLLRYRGRFWVVFREGQTHTSPDGVLRVISSPDGLCWEPAALIRSDTEDLRDGKLSVTPDGNLMLIGVGALNGSLPRRYQTYAWFSTNGSDWTTPAPIGDTNFWIWRVTWYSDIGYGIGYSTGTQKSVRLYTTADGRSFLPLVTDLHVPGYPNESAMTFLPDGTCLALLRRDQCADTEKTAQLGCADAPYTQWRWIDTGVQIGGPQVLLLPDGRLVAAVRLLDGHVRTALCWINPLTGKLSEFLALPSGGDTSYAGLVFHDGLLWVSYYSSHEGKTSIYLAKARLSNL